MSSIASRQKRMGYQRAYERERCQICAHRATSSNPVRNERGTYTCTRGAFETTAYSVCAEWQEIKQ